MPELFRAWAAEEPRARVVLFCAQEAKAPGARKQVVTKFRRLMSDYPSSDRHERTAPTCYADEAKPHLTNGLAGEVGRHPQSGGTRHSRSDEMGPADFVSHMSSSFNPTSTLVARYGAVGRDKMSIFNAGVTYLKNSDE
jgi:hypothetical protein